MNEGMKTDEAFEFLEKKDYELREMYLDLLAENVILKEKIEKLTAREIVGSD